jgi:hypothetical protein
MFCPSAGDATPARTAPVTPWTGAANVPGGTVTETTTSAFRTGR